MSRIGNIAADVASTAVTASALGGTGYLSHRSAEGRPVIDGMTSDNETLNRTTQSVGAGFLAFAGAMGFLASAAEGGARVSPGGAIFGTAAVGIATAVAVGTWAGPISDAVTGTLD